MFGKLKTIMKIFDSPNIIVIVYPPGGYGNFINYIVTHFFNETIKIEETPELFDTTGTAHRQKKYVSDIYPAIFDDYEINISVPYKNNEKIVLLYDSTVRNENNVDFNVHTQINAKFPNAVTIKNIVDLDFNPIIHYTSLLKTGYEYDHTDSQNMWESPDEDYSIRERWSLWYHSNPYQFSPCSDSNVVNIQLSKLSTDPVKTIIELAEKLNLTITDYHKLKSFCRNWIRVQMPYFKLLSTQRRIIRCIDNEIDLDISNITSLHDQGYINYCIEREYDVIIPVYDYKDWFKSTIEISEMIKCLK